MNSLVKMKRTARCRFKMGVIHSDSDFYSWSTVASAGLFIILFLAPRALCVEDGGGRYNGPPRAAPTPTSVSEIHKLICPTEYSQRNDPSPKIWHKDGLLYCSSTEPINWITSDMFQLLNYGEMALPFGIETKLVTCGTRNRSLSTTITEENSTIRIPYYFTSQIILSTAKYASDSVKNVRIFCGNFTPPSNSTLFPRFEIETDRDDGKLHIKIPPDQSATSPKKALSNERECEESDLIMYQNVTSGNCSCPSPELFHCANLMECRFLAHWMSLSKYKSACVVKKVEDLCNGTSLSLPDSSRRKGGLLFCDSKKEDLAPYILFYPSPQQQPNPNSTNMTNHKAENNLTEIQILGNDPRDFEQFLTLSILSPVSEKNMTTSSVVETECKGPGFLFLQGFLWSVTADTNSESPWLPNFKIFDPETKHSPDGEKYVSSTLTILPNHRNQSSVLDVTCEAALSDGNFFMSSNLTVKLEVHKPDVKGDFICQEYLLSYKCNTEEDVTWTWFRGNSTVFKPIQGDLPTARLLPNCSNEIITCTAILGNGVNNSYQFQPEHCRSFIQVNCIRLLPKVLETTLAPKPTTTLETTTPTTTTTTTTTGRTTEDFAATIKKDESPSSLTIGLIVAAVLFLLAFVFMMYKYFKTRKELRLLTATEIHEFVKGDPGKLKDVEVQGENAHLLPFNKKYEVSDSDYSIDHGKILGSGEFGTVYGGTLRGIPVAIKTTKSNTDVEFFKAFLKEIKVMTFLGEHPNVVQLLGTVTNRIRERVVFIIVELATRGCLHSFLREHQNNFVNSLSSSQLLRISPEQTNIPENGQSTVTTLDLVKWCGQIASGMSHLASKKIIHGDLAARNILLFDDYTAKITDFGLARQLYTSPNYVKKQQSPLPWRIMAPESLKNLQFSTKSDVWAFGVLAWEIFSLAAVPYSGLTWTHDFVEQLQQELRLQKPKWASNEIYENMCSCWHPVANCRPDFEHLENFYKEMLQHLPNESETVYLEVI